MSTKVTELKETPIRKSEYDLNTIESKIIGATKNGSNNETEAFLCLVQEIKKIKSFLNIE